MHIRDFDSSALPRGEKQTGRLAIAERAGGGDWSLPLMTVTGSEPGPTLVVTAAVHGDEYEGVAAIPQAFARVSPEALRGTLVMVPICNVPAYEAIQRSSPIDGLNLARVFPGDARGTLTQRIAHWMTEKLIRPADFYIDLHSGGIQSEIPTLIGYGYDDSPQGQASLAGAKAFGAPILWRHPFPFAPGRTISAAAEFGIPSLYTEAPGGGYAHPDDVACFAQGILNVMMHLDMIDGTPQPRPMTHHLFGDGNMDTVLDAEVAGFFRAEVKLLDSVRAGQRLGTVMDAFGAPLQTLVTQRDGIVILLRRFHRVNVGDGLAAITGVVGE
jgi:predicted deacylase